MYEGGCLMKKILSIVLTLLALYGCSDSTQGDDVEMIIDATQFSNLTSDELVNIMGEPESIEDYEWSIPKTNKSIVGKLYIYENNKFEFILFEDTVTRLNAYSGVYWGYDDSTFVFSSGKDVMKSFGITDTYKNMARTVNTGVVEKYEPVTEGIQKVEIHDIKENTFGLIRFTYDSNFYE